MKTQSRAEEFLMHYSGCESWLFVYLMTLLGNRDDAEEVFQETTLGLWRSFDDFEPGTDFTRWAKRVAFHRVLTFRKKKQRQGIPQSEEFLAAIHAAEEQQGDLSVARLRALESCVKRLPEADRQLVALRYTSKQTVPEMGQELGRSTNTIAKALKRIRRVLSECIQRTLSREGIV
jgi:RNA polymerase sigma-70 factor (ECF subfamily)